MTRKEKTRNVSTRIRAAALIVCFMLSLLMLTKNVHAAPAEGATIDSSGTSGTVTWELYTDGTMVIRPTSGNEGTMDSLNGVDAPWTSKSASIKKVETQGTIHLEGNANFMFYKLTNCTEMDLSGFDTKNVTSMGAMFSDCRALTSLDLSGFDTGNVTSMSGMFSGCSALTSLELSGFDTGNVTNMSTMFNGCSALTSLNLSDFDTRNVTNMSSMFSDCRALTSLDLSDFDTGNVTTMNAMFHRCSVLTSLDLSGFDTGNVTNMGSMFDSCSSLTSLDLSDFDTGNVTTMSGMFENCSALTSLDLSGLNTGKVTSMNSMFRGCSALTSLGLSDLDTGNVTSMAYMFSGCSALTSLDLSGLDTGKVTYLNNMFYNCSALTSLDLSDLDTGNVTSMNNMFYNCSALTSLDLSDLDTGNVTDMSSMFHYCGALMSLDLSCFNTGNVTNMSSMFQGCSSLTSLDLSGLDTGNVIHMNSMFNNCSALTSLDLSSFNTGNATTMSGMFSGCSDLTSLDLSGFDTGNVTTMASMFNGCSDLTSLDLSGFDTGKVTNMAYMFGSCPALTSLDLSDFDTGNVTNMYGMFSDCSALNTISVGENYRFKGNNITSSSKWAILPTPPSATTTGKWIREDGTVEGKTPAELRDQYDSNAAAWAGKWVWEVKTDSAIVMFDAAGGYTETSQVTVSPIAPVTVPAAERPAYYLEAWTQNADGTGTSYQPGDSFTPQAGKVTTLYAKWAKAATYRVDHLQQNADQTGYDVVESERLYARPEEVVTPQVKTYEGFIPPLAQTVSVAADDSTVIEYRYDRTNYTIKYDGNGAESGETMDQRMVGGVRQKLHDNRFKKENAVFNGWNTMADGTGTPYGDVQTVKDIAGNGETITLYAQWIDISNAARESTTGKYTVKIRPGETVSIQNLPAGTKYTVREVDNPDGWTQTGEEGTQGVIVSNETGRAGITNTYSASGKVSLLAYKQMEGGDVAEGEYEFELLDGDTVIQTARNGNPDIAEEVLDTDGETMVKNPYYGMNIVRFEEIEIDRAGDHVFTIREVKGDRTSVEYDVHTETVTVHAADNGNGTLTCTPEYDSDGPVFTNRKIPSFDEPDKTGRLLISKQVTNMPSSGQTFPFTIHLYDKEGTELTDEYDIDIVPTGNEDGYYTERDVTVTAVSHTQNLDDEGKKLKNYGNRWNNSNIRGTGREGAVNEAHVIRIPGAKELNVSIVYGGESSNYDWVCMWQGALPEKTAQDHASSFTGRLGGGSASSNKKTYTVPGDAVTFAFKSDGGSCGDGYGYYAVVTANVKETVFSDRVVSHEKTGSGGSFSLSSGQTAIIRGLPAGVTYKVEEGETAGFELVNAQGTEGSLTADGDTVPDVHAEFTNVYDGQGQAQIRMRKVFEGGELTEGKFSFRLLDGEGKEIETVTNDAEGNIVFSPISYGVEDIGERYSYSVVEVKGEDSLVLYDDHTENVIVSVTDGGDGNLNADVQYQGEALFTNGPALSDLKLKKTVVGNFASKAKLFTFTVTLTDEGGVPLAGTFTYDGDQSGSLTLDDTGSGTLQLSHGDEVTIHGIPIGTKYFVAETDYTEEGYETESENAQGVITQDVMTASFVNTLRAGIPTGMDYKFPAGASALVTGAVVLAFLYMRRKKKEE